MQKYKKMTVLLIALTIVIFTTTILINKNQEKHLDEDNIIEAFRNNKEVFIDIINYRGDEKSNEYLDKIKHFKEKTKGIGVLKSLDNSKAWFDMDYDDGPTRRGILYREDDIKPENHELGEYKRIEKNWFYYKESNPF